VPLRARGPRAGVLNHTNIAQIYGVEQRALAMEYVEGESPKDPMPFEDAWKVAIQIADALKYRRQRRHSSGFETGHS
jgi:hypothetical protein